MRWENKGHEYDEVYRQIEKKSRFYLFGAGEYGGFFMRFFAEEFEVIAFVDSNPMKQNTLIHGKNCTSLEQVTLAEDEAIILTISQYARAGAVEMLEKHGFQKNVDYFLMEEFLSVYYLYKYDKVYFLNLSFLPSTACNLKCRHCLNFNPFAKQFYVRDFEALKADVDLFFSCVDFVVQFHISGGEPMLYKQIADLVEYIDDNYRDRIGILRTVTNGTVIPPENVLQTLGRCKVEVVLDDYRDAVPKYKDNFDLVLQKFAEYEIPHYVNKVEQWIDLAPEKTDYSRMPEEWLIHHRDECAQTWQELRDGKLYSCNYAAYATVAGIAGEQDLEEVYNLREHTPADKKQLVEFRLGYTTKGYTNFCKTCRGFTTTNESSEIPAVQVEN